MKKKLVALAFVAISLVSFSSLAQDNTNGSTCTKSEQAGCQKGKKGDRPCPFEGLNITDAQKEQLQKLDQAKREQAKVQREQSKQQADGQRQEMKAKHQEAKRQYLADVKTILTPDQYVLFLENFYVNATPGGMHHKGAAKLDKKDGKMQKFSTAKDGRPGKTKDMKRPDKKAKAEKAD